MIKIYEIARKRKASYVCNAHCAYQVERKINFINRGSGYMDSTEEIAKKLKSNTGKFFDFKFTLKTIQRAYWINKTTKYLNDYQIFA